MSRSDEYVTVVSGLPRSGTSMMMRMLHHGGIPVLTDELRSADHDNPDGYYEYEPVKNLPHYKEWLADATGKVVKVIYKLVYELPSDVNYRVIFMAREISEVIASQDRMLERANRTTPVGTSAHFEQLFTAELSKFKSWAGAQPNIRIHYVDYHRVLSEPESVARELASFLDRDLDIAAMANVVNPALYRNRA